MNKKELFKQVNKLCYNLDNKYNINCGGCCYVAACIAEQLELKGIPFKVIHYELGINSRFHDFRDTHATKLIESGADIKAVSKRLGHSTIQTTYNIYVLNMI